MGRKREPRYKIFSVDNEYLGSMKHPIHAATFIGICASGTVRDGYSERDVVWNEGFEEFLAADSYHGAALKILERVEKRDSD